MVQMVVLRGQLEAARERDSVLYRLVLFSGVLRPLSCSLFYLEPFLLSPGLSLLLLPLLLVQAGAWGFPTGPLSLQELRREFTASLHLARKLLSEVQSYVHSFVSLLNAVRSGGGWGHPQVPLGPTNRTYPSG